jgi:hypothetical protein
MLRRVALVVTEVSDEPIVSIVRATRIDELGTTLPVFLLIMLQLVVVANVIPSSLILFT